MAINVKYNQKNGEIRTKRLPHLQKNSHVRNAFKYNVTDPWGVDFAQKKPSRMDINSGENVWDPFE